ncbi:MAG: DUF86 domain-containing protein [Cyanobacteria bacterium]|nr:DUF86 domain-containing protein [Cyanobacteriota bacterium]MDA0867389.1 DUF86 domain-containing protein [Cyanobacteriota bacterium]
MPAKNRDVASLLDMVGAIQSIQDFTASFSLETYLENALVQSAVERQLEILGEAATRISPGFRQAHPELDWRRIIGQRNILIHRYDQIRQEFIWAVIAAELVPLRAQLESVLAVLPGDGTSR